MYSCCAEYMISAKVYLLMLFWIHFNSNPHIPIAYEVVIEDILIFWMTLLSAWASTYAKCVIHMYTTIYDSSLQQCQTIIKCEHRTMNISFVSLDLFWAGACILFTLEFIGQTQTQHSCGLIHFNFHLDLVQGTKVDCWKKSFYSLNKSL